MMTFPRYVEMYFMYIILQQKRSKRAMYVKANKIVAIKMAHF